MLIVSGVASAGRVGRQPPVEIAGWGEARVAGDKMRALVIKGLASQLAEAGRQALEMAGLDREAIGHFAGYDAASIHLVNQTEGYGFLTPGDGLRAFRDGEMARGGRLPVNLAGS